VTKNVKSLQFTDTTIDKIDGGFQQIVHPTARSTAHMVVMVGDTVEPGFVLAGVQLLYDPGPHKQIQISVYRTKTDVG
jgi:hypothetical protein